MHKFFSVLGTPWKAFNYVEMRLLTPYVLLMAAIKQISIGTDARFYGAPIIQITRGSQITIGEGVRMRSTVRSNPLGASHPVILSTRSTSAKIIIGSHFGMTGGSIVADQSIIIGDHVNLGANCLVMDSDFHPIEPFHRLRDQAGAHSAPIVIEDHVFVGAHAIILKGIRVGAGSVIGAGSVVTKDVPSGVIVAGNPARIVRYLKEQVEPGSFRYSHIHPNL